MHFKVLIFNILEEREKNFDLSNLGREWRNKLYFLVVGIISTGGNKTSTNYYKLIIFQFLKRSKSIHLFCIWIWLYLLSLMFVTDNLLDNLILSNCLQMHWREIILTNDSFIDGINMKMKWVVTVLYNNHNYNNQGHTVDHLIWPLVLNICQSYSNLQKNSEVLLIEV